MPPERRGAALVYLPAPLAAASVVQQDTLSAYGVPQRYSDSGSSRAQECWALTASLLISGAHPRPPAWWVFPWAVEIFASGILASEGLPVRGRCGAFAVVVLLAPA